jgi:hypothetical protein
MRAHYVLAALLLLVATGAEAAWVGGWGAEENGAFALDTGGTINDCTRDTTTKKTGAASYQCTNTTGTSEAQETDSVARLNELDGDGASAAYQDLSCCAWIRATHTFYAREIFEVEQDSGSAAYTRISTELGYVKFSTNSSTTTRTNACAISADTWLRLCWETDNESGTGSDKLKVWCDEVPDASPALDVTMDGGFTTDSGVSRIEAKMTYTALGGQSYLNVDDFVCVNEKVSANATRAGQLYYAEVRSQTPDTAKLTPTVSLDTQDDNSCTSCDVTSDVAQCTGSDTSGDCERAANCLGGGASGQCTETQQIAGAHAVLMGGVNDYLLTGYPAHDSGIDSHDLYAVGCRFRASNNNTANNNYLRASTDSGCHSNSTCTPVGAGASGADQTWALDAATAYETVTWWMETDPDNSGSWTTTKLDNIACGTFKHTGAGGVRIEAHDVAIISSTPYSAGGRRDYWIDSKRQRPEGVLWAALASATGAVRGVAWATR